MSKLICDFSLFDAKKSNIKILVDNYNILLKSLESLENNLEQVWSSESQKSYYNKFIERKKELEQLSVYYADLVAFLDSISTTYQNIESKYS